MIKYRDTYLQNKAIKSLFDYRQLHIPLTDELAKWSIDNVVKITVANGLQKLAQVYPQDVITKMGIELLTEQLIVNATGPKRMNFDNCEQAYSWLLK